MTSGRLRMEKKTREEERKKCSSSLYFGLFPFDVFCVAICALFVNAIPLLFIAIVVYIYMFGL